MAQTCHYGAHVQLVNETNPFLQRRQSGACGSVIDAFVSLRFAAQFVKLKSLPESFKEQIALLVGQTTVAQMGVSTLSEGC